MTGPQCSRMNCANPAGWVPVLKVWSKRRGLAGEPAANPLPVALCDDCATLRDPADHLTEEFWRDTVEFFDELGLPEPDPHSAVIEMVPLDPAIPTTGTVQ